MEPPFSSNPARVQPAFREDPRLACDAHHCVCACVGLTFHPTSTHIWDGNHVAADSPNDVAGVMVWTVIVLAFAVAG